jgi:hypothetical protein
MPKVKNHEKSNHYFQIKQVEACQEFWKEKMAFCVG